MSSTRTSMAGYPLQLLKKKRGISSRTNIISKYIGNDGGGENQEHTTKKDECPRSFMYYTINDDRSAVRDIPLDESRCP